MHAEITPKTKTIAISIDKDSSMLLVLAEASFQQGGAL